MIAWPFRNKILDRKKSSEKSQLVNLCVRFVLCNHFFLWFLSIPLVHCFLSDVKVTKLFAYIFQMVRATRKIEGMNTKHRSYVQVIDNSYLCSMFYPEGILHHIFRSRYLDGTTFYLNNENYNSKKTRTATRFFLFSSSL